MAKRKVKRWWISRDGKATDFYNFHHCADEPKPIITCYPMECMVANIRGRGFRELYTIRLKEGECKEIERPVLVLKAKKKGG
ncbi:hypothetical protein LCGC14_0752960 [marine sediment metagenome]|uniref:Uncharacterized protein n=1 Tax=marine sediment metagenome TaxID=412755 RepID=A0A0F9QN97_9ZZZZ